MRWQLEALAKKSIFNNDIFSAILKNRHFELPIIHCNNDPDVGKPPWIVGGHPYYKE